MLTGEWEEYWKTVVNTIQDGVMVVDTEGVIVSVNRGFEEITGYTAEEAVGKTCHMLHCSACEVARSESCCHWCVLFREGQLHRKRCMLRHRQGHWVHVMKNAQVLKDKRDRVCGAVETLTDITELVVKEHRIARFERERSQDEGFHGMIGRSRAMVRLFELAEDAAQSDAPVIICGESGTGKELLAGAIHDLSPRRQRPYVKLNCAALNEALLESELFGHVRGAYTGAARDRMGRFEAAHTGSLFLDEIGDLPGAAQVKLLRVLEEKVIERVGDHRPIPVDVRLISATNRKLDALVASGTMREDFFYRINVIPLRLPPLRERVEDIPLLARLFFKRLQVKTGKPIERIATHAMDALMHHSWPGNVRELRSAFEFAFVCCRGDVLELEHFPDEMVRQLEQGVQFLNRAMSLDEIKKQRLMDALNACHGNISRVARDLNASRTTIYNQMRRYGLT